jgi:hypothetical protein
LAVTLKYRRADGSIAPVEAAVIRIGGRYAATAEDGSAMFDGVPAGSYRLTVEHPGFLRFVSDLVLPEGKRDPLDVVLTPETLVDVKGRVMEDGGQPLAGAAIKFSPLDVPSSVQGVFEFISGWDGGILAIDVPSGKYRAEISCPGCQEKSFEFAVAGGMADLKFSLDRRRSPASLDVTVVDVQGLKPVAGAKVALAEDWPKGMIAEAPADASGTVRFRDLRLGDLNWPDEKGLLSIARPQVTVRAEAEGFEPMIVPATLALGAAVTIRLNSRLRMPSDGSNASLQQAMVIRTGCPVELTIPKPGDQRFFRFRFPYPAEVKVAVGPANPIEIHQRVLASDGKLLAENASYLNQDNVITLRLGAGEYYVQVMEWGNNGASPQPVTLTVGVEFAADPHEPNDTPEAAKLISRNQEVRGRIWPNGDADYFRYEVSRPGRHRFTMPPCALERHLAVFDGSGKKLAEQAVYTNLMLDFTAELAPGTYRIAVREWGDNNSSLDPYSLRVEACEDDGVDDPADRDGRPAAVRFLNLNQSAAATINPIGDFDTFALAVPTAGVLHIQGRFSGESHIRLLSGAGRILGEQAVYANQPVHFACSFQEPAAVFIRVLEWGSNNWGASSYRVFAWFEPCDELEWTGRNDAPETAIPAVLGETLRGSLNPVGDADMYSLTVDHPGYLRLGGNGPTELHVRLRDGANRLVAEQANYARQPIDIRSAVLPGEYRVEVYEWGNNGRHSGGYAIRTALERAEPDEIVPLNQDPARALTLGQAQSFAIDHIGDVDRFILNVPRAGKFSLKFLNPLELHVRVYDDQTGALVAEKADYLRANPILELETKGPTRYRLDLMEWGNNNASLAEGYVLADEKGLLPGADRLSWVVDPFDPTLVRFTRSAVEGWTSPVKLSVDVTADGRGDFDVPAGPQGAAWRFPAEGLYKATAVMEAAPGGTAQHSFWVEAVGQTERRGVFLVVDYPYEGQTVERDLPCRARALSFSGKRIQSVSLAVNGAEIGRVYSLPYEFEVPWRTVGGGERVLTLTAVDDAGEKAVVKRTVRISDYFDLRPADNAVLSGSNVRVSWTGRNFGQASVRYRPKGETEWRTAVGQNGRFRLVDLAGLEPGTAYEFRPEGGGEPGPVRAVTRVKGLAFGRSRYGATIRRDYDQRVGVSVRNHADKPLTVRLECGLVPEESRLLAGFVGEGSEGAPLILQPGEERDFLLGISAQDSVRAENRFPIRITSDSGFSDEAEVDLRVVMPDVKLEWEPAGDKPSGTGKVFRLRNKGDGLTDLYIESSTSDIILSPSVQHALFPPGGTIEITADARLYEGFSAAEGKLTARAADKRFSTDVRIALKEGQSLFSVPLVPGLDPSAEPGADSQLLAARAAAGAYLNAANADWTLKSRPEDADGDGRMDRWFVEDGQEDTLWVGDDTDGDGEIDFVHADIGRDGVFDYSALRSKAGWEPTNLVEAWLEMGFSLPWARNAYEKHDVDIVVNGVVIGKLREAVPEGNYAFRMPSSVLKFNAAGELEANQIEIQSRHLRGGHYVVTSNFNIRYRLTGTRLWIAAGTREEANRTALASPGLVMDGPDYSLSSAEIRLDGPTPPAKGSDVGISVLVRNMGATRDRNVPLALMAAAPGAPGVVIARQEIQDMPLLGSQLVRLPWKAAAGTHALRVVVDPENLCGDVDRSNNEAILFVTVPGDDAKPSVRVLGPADGAVLKETAVAVLAEAEDDSGIALVEARVDNGLWTRLPGAKTYEGTALLQPGPHGISVRATDGSGNQVEQTVKVTVEARPPEVRILTPAEGTSFNVRQAEVKIKSGPGTVLLAVRVNGGPWKRLEAQDGAAAATIPLSFGPAVIEAAAVDSRGAMGLAAVRVQCVKQPEAQDAAAAEAEGAEEGWVRIEGFGLVNMFGPPSQILPISMPAAPPGGPPRKDASSRGERS